MSQADSANDSPWGQTFYYLFFEKFIECWIMYAKMAGKLQIAQITDINFGSFLSRFENYFIKYLNAMCNRWHEGSTNQAFLRCWIQNYMEERYFFITLPSDFKFQFSKWIFLIKNLSNHFEINLKLFWLK